MLNRGFRRVAGATSFGVALAAAGTGMLAATHPAAAASVIAQITSAAASTCSATSACLAWTNLSSGPALWGTSATGVGSYGKSTTRYGMQGDSVSNFGVRGTSTSGLAGTAGTMVSGTGVYGYVTASSGSTGVAGYAPNGYGVYGSTGGNGFGVVGSSTTGIGVYGSTTTGIGGYLIAGSGTAAEAVTSSGTALRILSDTGYGINVANSGGLSVLARNSNGNAGDFAGSYLGIIGRSPAAGYPIVATDPNGNNLFYVDGGGAVWSHNGFHTFTRTAGGANATAFSPKATLPTLEDTGTAQLVGGASTVRLDPTFAATIDARASYRVFLTPNGDTRGLFVALKTPNGFVVRESQGGRSSVSFDYRIVATAVGEAGQHMTLVNTSALTGPQALPKVAPAAVKLPRPPAALTVPH